jgi:ankyrin repeat protein
VSAGLVNAMELNDGPAWRAAAPTLRLHAAFRDGKKDEATALLGGAAPLQLDRHARGLGEPLLHLALARGWDEACKGLIRRGVNVDEHNSRGQPPLDCFGSSLTVARYLLDAGAKAATDVALASLTGFVFPASFDRSDWIDATCMRLLALLPKPWQKQDPNFRAALFNALRFGHKRTTLALLQEQVELTPALFASFPPLHFAAAGADLEACKLLVARDGTALARRNVLQQTALHHAAATGQAASVRLLRELGARAHAESDLQGCRMRNYAARWLVRGAVAPYRAVWEELMAAEEVEIEKRPQ